MQRTANMPKVWGESLAEVEVRQKPEVRIQKVSVQTPPAGML